MFHLYNHSELQNLFFKYCQSEDLKNLKMTCKSLYSLIPNEWTIDEIYITEKSQIHLIRFLEKSDSNLYILDENSDENSIRKFIFCEKMIMSCLCNILSIVITLELLTEIDIICCPNVKFVHIFSKKINNIFLSRLSNCEKIIISETLTQIKRIHILETKISRFVISPTWTELKSITLNHTLLTDLIIPKTCINLLYIDISNNPKLKNLYIYSLLKKKFIVQNMNTPDITIHIMTKIIQNIWVIKRNYNIIELI